MKSYALLIDGVYKESRDYAEKPVDIPHKKISWHEVVYAEGAPKQGLESGKWVIYHPAPEELPVKIQVVSARQGRLALHAAGLLETVDALVQQSSPEIKIAWEYTTEFRRDDPILTSMLKDVFKKTDEEIDALFLAASQY